MSDRRESAVMILPIRLRPIDWSVVQFAVLLLCTLGAIFCAFHFANPHEMRRALITLSDRHGDVRSQPSATPESGPPTDVQWTEEQVRPAAPSDSSLVIAQKATEPNPVSTPEASDP
jgi:hypothetical protein